VALRRRRSRDGRRSHIRVIPQLKDLAKLVAVCDIAPQRAHRGAGKEQPPGVPIYDDVAKMLKERPEIEVIHLATPSGAHLEPALAAMRRESTSSARSRWRSSSTGSIR
jgi:predicted dehydrogenase